MYKKHMEIISKIQEEASKEAHKANDMFIEKFNKFEDIYNKGLICETEKLLKQAELINNCLKEQELITLHELELIKAEEGLYLQRAY